MILTKAMKRITIFCFALLSVVSVGDAATCFSTVGCPGNETVCMLNCSEIAVNDFNQPASHGNCRITLTFDGFTIQGCYIHECNSNHPEQCVPEIVGNHVGAECCCTGYLCNDGFDYVVPTNSTNNTLPGDSTNTTNGNNDTTHIYPTYPTHVAEDELVCVYQQCTIGECDDIKYEVCSENPVYANVTGRHFICHGVFIVNTDTGNYTTGQQCFHERNSFCPKECIPVLHSTLKKNEALYDCCCVGNLCNNVTFNYTAAEDCSVTSVSGRVKHIRKKTKFGFLSDGGPKVTYKCKLDDMKFKDCTSPVVWRNLKKGKHTVSLKASCIDNKGKKSTVRRKFKFQIHS